MPVSLPRQRRHCLLGLTVLAGFTSCCWAAPGILPSLLSASCCVDSHDQHPPEPQNRSHSTFVGAETNLFVRAYRFEALDICYVMRCAAVGGWWVLCVELWWHQVDVNISLPAGVFASLTRVVPANSCARLIGVVMQGSATLLSSVSSVIVRLGKLLLHASLCLTLSRCVFSGNSINEMISNAISSNINSSSSCNSTQQ